MIQLILFCFGTACLTLFLDMCFQKGMIFRKYYNWITYWLYLPVKKTSNEWQIKGGPDYHTTVTCSSGISNVSFYRCDQVTIKRPKFIKNEFIWLWKILGGCSYCFGTWAFIALFFFLHRAETNLFELFQGIGINYVFIKAIEKL